MSLLLVLGGTGPVGVTADWNATEGRDSAAFAATLRVDAAWAALEAGDNAQLVAQLRIDAAWASVEGADSSAFAGSVTATAAWASVEGADSAAFVGNLAVQGAWNAPEGADIAAFSGNVSGATSVEAVWNATEGGDSGAFAVEVTPQAQPFFPRGGGPFTRKYGYYGYDEDDDDLESARGVRQALDREGVEVVHAAAQRAASAIRNGDPEPVLDAERVYAEVIERVRGTAAREVAGILAKDRVDAYWRAEVRKRLQERDDEEVVLMIAELL